VLLNAPRTDYQNVLKDAERWKRQVLYSLIQTFLYQILRKVEVTSGFGARGRPQRHFTCFTGTKVHILTHEERRQAAEGEASVEQAGIKGLPSSDVQALHNEVIIENLHADVC
jgi:hypothetical protein